MRRLMAYMREFVENRLLEFADVLGYLVEGLISAFEAAAPVFRYFTAEVYLVAAAFVLLAGLVMFGGY